MNNTIQRIFKTSVWLLAINAIFLLLLLMKYVDFRYEYALYRSMFANNAVKGDEQQTFINLVALTNRIQTDRQEQVKGMSGMNPLKSRWFRSGDVQLLDATGACGNFSHVLAELCQSGGIESRIVQLYQHDHYGSHMITEAKVNGRWVVADGLFKMCFYNPDSSLASLDEIKANYSYYEKQFPMSYPYKDAYYRYRYSNWEKIPIFGSATYGILRLILGTNEAEVICLRSYFLNLHRAQFWLLIVLYIPIGFKTFQHLGYWLKSVFAKPV